MKKKKLKFNIIPIFNNFGSEKLFHTPTEAANTDSTT